MSILIVSDKTKGNGIAPDLRPVQTQKVYIVAANQLARMISAGVWGPGTRLPPERELSETLRISRVSVRQALIALESVGVLRSKRGVGHFVEIGATVVADKIVEDMTSQGDPQELLEARRILEPEVARLAALNRDSDDLARLHEVIERMEIEEKRSNLEQYFEVDFFFHEALGYATHNPVLIDLQQVIVQRLKTPSAMRASRTVVPKRFVANREEHNAILAAVAARDPKAARHGMILHLLSISKALQHFSSFAESTD